MSIQFSLRRNVLARFNEAFRECISKSEKDQQQQSGLILVCDSQSLRLLSSCVSMSELLKMGVQCIEQLVLRRKRFSRASAMYLIHPTKENIDLLHRDFIAGYPLYGSVHMFVTQKLPESLFDEIASNDELVKRLKTLKEFYHSFEFFDDNTILLPRNQLLPSGSEGYLQFLADSLISCVPAMLRISNVSILARAQGSGSASMETFRLQSLVSQKLSQYMNGLHGEGSKYLDRTAGDLNIVLLDRGEDPLFPLIHDCHYEAMIYELLEADQTNRSLLLKSNKEFEIGDVNDEIYAEYRFKHIAACLEGIQGEFNLHLSRKPVAAVKSDDPQLANLENAARGLKEYEERMALLVAHMEIIERCHRVFEARDIQTVAEWEQCLVTGVDPDGSKGSAKQAVQGINEGFRLNSKIGVREKLRLAALALRSEASQRVMSMREKEVMQKMLIENGASSVEFALQGLVPVKRVFPSEAVQKKTSLKVKGFKENVDLEICRGIPESSLIVEEILKNIEQQKDAVQQLNWQKLGFNETMIFSLNGKANVSDEVRIQMKDTSNDQNASSDQFKGYVEGNLPFEGKVNAHEIVEEQVVAGKTSKKVVFFFVGGVTAAEIRAVDQLRVEYQKKNVTVVIASTHLLTPDLYLDKLIKTAPFV